ncbi:MAG: DNA repair protein RecO [Planctomycetota bacterium]|jgi:DNA repair protein RecO
MAAAEDDAICIRHWDYSETSQTVGLLTLRHGVVRAIAKGARRERSGFSGGVDLLTAGRGTLLIKPNQTLATLTGWQLHDHFPKIRSSLVANRVAFYAADLVSRLTASNDPHPAMYRGLLNLLRQIGGRQSEQVTQSLLLEFQWLMLHEGGLQPVLGALEGDDGAVLFAPHDGGKITTNAEGLVWKVRPATVRLLQSLQRDGGLPEGTIDRESLQRANRLLAAYIREIIGEQPPTMLALFGEIT